MDHGGRMLHARIPAPLVFDHVTRPSYAPVEPVQRPKPSKGAADLAETMKKGRKGKDHGRPERAVKISIEGRQLHNHTHTSE